MRPIRQAIILGAGASKSEGAPLQNELFKEFLGYYRRVLKKKWTLPKNREELIIEFFEDFWRIDIDRYRDQNVHFPMHACTTYLSCTVNPDILLPLS